MRIILFNNVADVDDGAPSLSNPNDVPDGQISVLDVDGSGNLDLTGANATDRMQFVQGNSEGRPVVSPIIKKSDVLSAHTVVYRAPAKQETSVGFDGSSGDIGATAGEDYILKLAQTGNSIGAEPYPRVSASHYAATGDTPYDIASGIARNAALNDKFFADVDALVEVSSAQATTAGPANITLDIKKGASAGEVSGAPNNFSAGDYLRIGHATDDAYPVYKVKSLDGTTVVLDRPYAGASGATIALGVLSAAPTASDAAGLSILAQEAGIGFVTAVSDAFSDGPVSVATPDKGSGSYSQVRKLEEDAGNAYAGFFDRYTPLQNEKPRYFADSSLTYDIVVVKVKNNTTRNIGGPEGTHYELHLAFKAGELSSASADIATFLGV